MFFDLSSDIARSSSYGIESIDARVATTAGRGNKNDRGHASFVLKLKQEVFTKLTVI